MSTLDRFLEAIRVAGQSLGEEHQAYRMDGHTKPDMRIDVGLGTCNCCDYFLSRGNTVVLIEETRLIESMQSQRDQYHYIPDNYLERFVDERVVQENRIKVYGSMLVLCRLAAKYVEARNMLQPQTKKYEFWLVTSNIQTPEDSLQLDSKKDLLFDGLRSVLTGQIVDNVDIIPSDHLAPKLAEYAANS